MSVYKWPIKVEPFGGDHGWGVFWIAEIADCTIPGKTKPDVIFKAKKARRRFVRYWNDKEYRKYGLDYIPDTSDWWRKYTTNGRSK